MPLRMFLLTTQCSRSSAIISPQRYVNVNNENWYYKLIGEVDGLRMANQFFL